MMVTSTEIPCPSCEGGGRVFRDRRAPGKPRYWCRQCDEVWVAASVSATRRVAAEDPGFRAIEEGFIPWGVLDPGVKRAYADVRNRLNRGKGPGSSVGRATKLLGMRPCRGCRDRIAALDSLGWIPVLLYTGAVAGFTVMVQWLAF